MNAFARNQSGATAIEYALLTTIITIGIIAALTAMGSSITSTFSDVSSHLG